MTQTFLNLNAPVSQLGLLLIAMLLGMRHGLDLDHLAMIDSITRRLPLHSKLSRFVGLLFSLGHGIVVILFCILIHFFVNTFSLPNWLGNFMIALSISFLILFGTINLYSLFSKKNRVRKPVFLVKKFKCLNPENPWFVLSIGGVFAVSFDTVSQLTLFSMNTVHFAANIFPLLLGFIFMIGMIITDSINGLIIASLIRKASKFSQIFTLAIGLFSTTIGIYEAICLI